MNQHPRDGRGQAVADHEAFRAENERARFHSYFHAAEECRLQALDVEIADHASAIQATLGLAPLLPYQVFLWRHGLDPALPRGGMHRYDEWFSDLAASRVWDGMDREAEAQWAEAGRDARFHRQSRQLARVGVCVLLALVAYETLAHFMGWQGVF